MKYIYIIVKYRRSLTSPNSAATYTPIPTIHPRIFPLFLHTYLEIATGLLSGLRYGSVQSPDQR